MLAAAPLALLAVLAASTVLALLTDQLSALPVALSVVVSTNLLGVGAAALCSVVAPMNRARGGRAGAARTATQVLWQLATMVAIGVVAYATARWLPDAGYLLVAVAGIPLAAALGWFGLRVAGRRLARDPWRVQHALAT